jgi:hypothetical protein
LKGTTPGVDLPGVFLDKYQVIKYRVDVTSSAPSVSMQAPA